MPGHRAEVLAAWDEGPLLRGIRLSAVPAYQAGQALEVYDGAAHAMFALATAHGRGRSPELLLRRGGGVADALIRGLEAGSQVQFDGPRGPGVPLQHAREKDVLLVAAGSAISAIRSVIETLLDDREAYGRIVLFYGQEQAGEFAYAEARASWAARGVEITLCAHRPEPDWVGGRGFVQDVIIAQGPGVDALRAVAYLCGMPGMVSGVREALAPLGIPPERTYLNY
jgi:sulfhydrogenase subunit gamma (sulfur reductase)